MSSGQGYGFLNAYTGYFTHVTSTENEVNELGSMTEDLTAQERRAQRLKHENEKWDEDHYMCVLIQVAACSSALRSSIILNRADFADDDMIQELVSYRFPPESPLSKTSSPITFTEEENLIMLRLPTKDCTCVFNYWRSEALTNF